MNDELDLCSNIVEINSSTDYVSFATHHWDVEVVATYCGPASMGIKIKAELACVTETGYVLIEMGIKSISKL